MASQPGPLYEFPWRPMGNLKYLVLAPLLVHHVSSEWSDADQVRIAPPTPETEICGLEWKQAVCPASCRAESTAEWG